MTTFNPFFLNKWVRPFYLNILHGNYVSLLKGEEKQTFIKDVLRVRNEINPKVYNKLLEGGWREKITGGWFAGVFGKSDLTSIIGQKFIESEFGFAGQAYAFTMACFSSEESQKFLYEYLKIYLDKTDCYYDQSWAMPALIWTDKQLKTDLSSEFLSQNGLWKKWRVSHSIENDIDNCYEDFYQQMLFIERYFRKT